MHLDESTAFDLQHLDRTHCQKGLKRIMNRREHMSAYVATFAALRANQDLVNSDILHICSPDRRDLDAMMHVNLVGKSGK